MGSGFGVPAAARVVHAPGAEERVLGYVLCEESNDRCRVAEAGGSGDNVNAAIVRFLGRKAVQLRREWITASLRTDHSLALFCRRLGYRQETRYPNNSGPMGRIIDLTRFLTALAPELANHWPEAAEQKLLCCGDEAATLTRQTGEGAPRRDRTGTTTGGSPKTGRRARVGRTRSCGLTLLS